MKKESIKSKVQSLMNEGLNASQIFQKLTEQEVKTSKGSVNVYVSNINKKRAAENLLTP